MANLPKIAQARLKGKPGPPKESAGNKGGFVALGGHHPDANLLAAFAEKALTETERARLLNHLSQCAECREITAFALQDNSAESDSLKTTATRQSSTWPILRWGTLAAMMAALAIVIVVHPNIWRNQSRVTSNEPRADSAENQPLAISSPPAAPPSSPAGSRTGLPARTPAAQADTKKSLGAPENSVQDRPAAQLEARQQVTTLASTEPPSQIQSAPSSNAKQISGGAGVAAVQIAPPAPESTVALKQAQASSVSTQRSPSVLQAEQQNSPGSGGAFAEKVAPHAAAEQSASVQTETTPVFDQQIRQDSGAAGRQETAKAKTGAVSVGGFMSPAALSSRGTASAAPRWFVTSEGKVVKLVGGGNTPEAVPIAEGVKFRSVAALGDDVWAGGMGGALFHSTDGGSTWNRVPVSLQGSALNETITGIRLSDAQHVIVTISSGAQFTSDDAGQHWR